MAEEDQILEASTSRSAKKAKIDWRDKCIHKFNLQPVPEAWQDRLSSGSERAWKRYYQYRKNPKKNKRGDKEDDESFWPGDDGEEDEEGEDNLLRVWNEKLNGLAYGIFQSQDEKWRCKWRASLSAGRLVWEDYDVLRSAEYYAHVWSPYVIPHAIHLKHRFHSRKFSVVWGYQLLDFEESLDDHEDEEFTTICSNDYTDDKEMNDIIDASNINQSTVHRLCRFLFGASSQSKQVCDDFSFLRLLFGSMGTFHSVSLMMEGWIGYS
jgi:hypothetical protein